MSSLIDKVQTVESPKTEEVPNCPFCKSSETRLLFWNFDRLYHLPGRFGIVQCCDCQLVRLSPRPMKDSLPFYYPEEDYYSFQAPASIDNLTDRGRITKIREGIRQAVFDHLYYPVGKLSVWQKALQPILVRLLSRPATYGREFPEYKENGFALDIGCGSGSYLSLLKHYGWKVFGVDLSQKAAESAKKNFGIDVHIGELESIPFPPNTFDYINMSHVLEHVASPVDTLKKVKELLKPGGIVYAEVPNYESFSRKRSQEYWYPWETPRHLFMFSPQTLEQAFKESGLEIIKIETVVYNFFAWESTYKLEEKLGRKLDSRPFITKSDKLKILLLSLSARISRLLKPSSGDFVCCRAIKK